MTIRRTILAAGLLLLAACGSGKGLGGLGGNDCPLPTVAIDHPTTGFRHNRVVVMSDSTFGSTPWWTWTLKVPPGSSAALDSAQGASSTSFTPDVSGTYVVGVTVKDACGESDPAQLSVVISNRQPVASAGANQTVAHGASLVTLDATGSSDPDGDPLQFAWARVSSPPGSAVTLSDFSAAQPTFVADRPGTYVFSVTVNDGEALSPAATVSVVATNEAPTANAGPAQAVNLPAAISLAGSASDPNGDPLTYRWSILQKPAGSTSASFSNSSSPTSQFTPDVEGAYVLGLTANDGYVDGPQATIQVTAYRHVETFGHDVLDVAYSAALDRVVMISQTPSSSLYIYDPASRTETSVALSLAPRRVALSPDGLFAAVGHNGYFSYVDLTQAALVSAPVAVSANVSQIALSATKVFILPYSSGWPNLHTVDLSSGTDTQSTSQVYFESNAMRLHPSGTALYSIDVGVSPVDLRKYSIDKNGVAQVSYDSQYHGDYELGDNFWFTSDGAKIITGGGTLFSVDPSATSNTNDLVYAGALEGYPASYSTLQWVAHDGAVNETAVIPANSWTSNEQRDVQLKLYSGDYFAALSTIDLPKLISGGTAYLEHGRYVFYTADGSQKIVIVAADPGAPSTFGVVVY